MDRRDEAAAVSPDAKRTKWDEPTAAGSPYAPPAAPPPQAGVPAVVPVAATLASLPHLADGPQLDATGRMLAFEDADVTFKLSLHHDVIAALLGTDGTVITTIRERTGCRMKVLNGTAGQNMLLEMGGVPEQMCTAAGLVLAEMQNSCASNPAVCSIESFRGESAAVYTVVMRVRADACGCIIGKGGASITQLRQTSNAHVKVETTEASSSTAERDITIMGYAAPATAAPACAPPPVSPALHHAAIREGTACGPTWHARRSVHVESREPRV